MFLLQTLVGIFLSGLILNRLLSGAFSPCYCHCPGSPLQLSFLATASFTFLSPFTAHPLHARTHSLTPFFFFASHKPSYCFEWSSHPDYPNIFFSQVLFTSPSPWWYYALPNAISLQNQAFRKLGGGVRTTLIWEYSKGHSHLGILSSRWVRSISRMTRWIEISL